MASNSKAQRATQDEHIADNQPSTASQESSPAGGIKLEWDSDADIHIAAQAAKERRHGQHVTKHEAGPGAHEATVGSRHATGKSSSSRSSLTSHETKYAQVKSLRPKPESVLSLEATEAMSEDDELDQPLPPYLQQRYRESRQLSIEYQDGPMRLPPIPEVDSFRQNLGIIHKPSFKQTRSCGPPEDVVFRSCGPDPGRRGQGALHQIGVLPSCIAKWLREYQIQGAQFLLERFVWQHGGILGDDMGLGKTIQVIAFLTAAFGKTGESRDLHHRRAVRLSDSTKWYPKVLIICPGTLMDNWESELSTWGFWQVDRYHGLAINKEAVLSAARSGSIEIVLTTYHTYRQNHDQINLVEWDCVVADECHIIKERTSLVTKAMNNINALCRIGLTGTAIQNNYAELWTLLNWANPGAISSYSSWKTLISKPLQKGQAHDATTYDHGVARRTALALKNELLPRFFLRRWKSLIADQLPKKSDRVVFCPLTELQANAYKSFVGSPMVQYIRDATQMCQCGSGDKAGWCCKKFIDNDPAKPWNLFSFPAIHALRSISNHLALLIPDSTGEVTKYERALEIMRLALPQRWMTMMQQKDSIYNLNNREYCGKFEVLLKLLAWWHEHGDKVLIFSHSVKLLKGLHLLFSSTSYSCSYLDGSMNYDDRTQEVNKFNNDDQQFVFLISIRAGGVGLNITSANKVVILDPNWNPSHDLQAQDRAYRIGQTRDVEVFRLISIGTVEETVYARQIYKQQQASIGYNASLERRYFSGVQGDQQRKGELFGLGNLFAYHDDQVLLQSIVNKTNIAESRAGLLVTDIDLKVAVVGTSARSNDDSADSSIKQLAEMLNERGSTKSRRANSDRRSVRNNASGIEHILANAGVHYFHENSEVIGTSRVESRLSKRAIENTTDDHADTEVIFEDAASQRNENAATRPSELSGRITSFRPSEAVRIRQFCTMAQFAQLSTVDFATRVESWTQKDRRDFLDDFYAMRAKQFKPEAHQHKLHNGSFSVV